MEETQKAIQLVFEQLRPERPVADRVIQWAGFYQMDIHVAGEMCDDIACSIDKAKMELGYSPTVDLEEGMRRSIEWCASAGGGQLARQPIQPRRRDTVEARKIPF